MPEKKDIKPDRAAPDAAVIILEALTAAGIEAVVDRVSTGTHDTVILVIVKKGK